MLYNMLSNLLRAHGHFHFHDTLYFIYIIYGNYTLFSLLHTLICRVHGSCFLTLLHPFPLWRLYRPTRVDPLSSIPSTISVLFVYVSYKLKLAIFVLGDCCVCYRFFNIYFYVFQECLCYSLYNNNYKTMIIHLMMLIW